LPKTAASKAFSLLATGLRTAFKVAKTPEIEIIKMMDANNISNKEKAVLFKSFIRMLSLTLCFPGRKL